MTETFGIQVTRSVVGAILIALLGLFVSAPHSAALAGSPTQPAHAPSTTTYDALANSAHHTLRIGPVERAAGRSLWWLKSSQAAKPASFSPKFVAAKTAGGAADDLVPVWRAVGSAEKADIGASGAFRNPAGLEGKYFFANRAQAENFGQMMNKSPAFGRPNYLTSGLAPRSIVSGAEAMEAGTEGAGIFVRGGLEQIVDVTIHGLIP